MSNCKATLELDQAQMLPGDWMSPTKGQMIARALQAKQARKSSSCLYTVLSSQGIHMKSLRLSIANGGEPDSVNTHPLMAQEAAL